MTSSHSQELREKIEKLIEINTKYMHYMNIIKDIKNEKSTLEKEVTQLLEELKLENKTFKLNNHKIQQKSCLSYQALSMKYIQNSLSEHLDDDTLTLVMNVLKANRNKVEKKELMISAD